MKSFWFVNLGLSSFCCKQVDIVAKRGPRKIWTKCVVEGRAVPAQVSFSNLLLNNSSPLFLLLSDKSIHQKCPTGETFPKVRTRTESVAQGVFCQIFPPGLHCTPALFIKCPSNSRATATSEEFYWECVFELIPYCSPLWTSIFVRFKRSLLWHCLSENKQPTRRPNIINDLSDLFKENVALLCLFAKVHFLFR